MHHCVGTHRHSANATNLTAKILFALSSSENWTAKCFTLGTGVDNENYNLYNKLQNSMFMDSIQKGGKKTC